EGPMNTGCPCKQPKTQAALRDGRTKLRPPQGEQKEEMKSIPTPFGLRRSRRSRDRLEACPEPRRRASPAKGSARSRDVFMGRRVELYGGCLEGQFCVPDSDQLRRR